VLRPEYSLHHVVIFVQEDNPQITQMYADFTERIRAGAVGQLLNHL